MADPLLYFGRMILNFDHFAVFFQDHSVGILDEPTRTVLSRRAHSRGLVEAFSKAATCFRAWVPAFRVSSHSRAAMRQSPSPKNTDEHDQNTGKHTSKTRINTNETQTNTHKHTPFSKEDIFCEPGQPTTESPL